MEEAVHGASQKKTLKMQSLDAFKQLVHFGWEQSLSCLFPVVIFAALALTQIVDLPFLPRYDWLLIIFLAMQWIMVRSGLETRDELKVITLFHVIGLALELFKVNMGSWAYPGEGYSKVLGVPLYSGFMYASVASYLCQAWRRLKIELVNWPPFWAVVPLTAAIYLNFYTHHFWIDIRMLLFAFVVIVFWKARVSYEITGVRYRMPLALSFILIGFFIWLAENIATFFGAWTYPNQEAEWQFVPLGKVSSWILLVIVSFLIVASLKLVKKKMREI